MCFERGFRVSTSVQRTCGSPNNSGSERTGNLIEKPLAVFIFSSSRTSPVRATLFFSGGHRVLLLACDASLGSPSRNRGGGKRGLHDLIHQCILLRVSLRAY